MRYSSFSVNVTFLSLVIPTAVERVRAFTGASRPEGPCACFLYFTLSTKPLQPLGYIAHGHQKQSLRYQFFGAVWLEGCCPATCPEFLSARSNAARKRGSGATPPDISSPLMNTVGVESTPSDSPSR